MAKQVAVYAVFLSTKILLEPLLTHVNSLLPSLSTAILFFFSFSSQTRSFLFQLF